MLSIFVSQNNNFSVVYISRARLFKWKLLNIISNFFFLSKIISNYVNIFKFRFWLNLIEIYTYIECKAVIKEREDIILLFSNTSFNTPLENTFLIIFLKKRKLTVLKVSGNNVERKKFKLKYLVPNPWMFILRIFHFAPLSSRVMESIFPSFFLILASFQTPPSPVKEKFREITGPILFSAIVRILFVVHRHRFSRRKKFNPSCTYKGVYPRFRRLFF